MFGCDKLNRTSWKTSSQAQSNGRCTLSMIVSISHMCNPVFCSEILLCCTAHWSYRRLWYSSCHDRRSWIIAVLWKVLLIFHTLSIAVYLLLDASSSPFQSRSTPEEWRPNKLHQFYRFIIPPSMQQWQSHLSIWPQAPFTFCRL
jgi:hypothetical protein